MLPENRERHASEFYRAILSLYDRPRQQAAVEFFGQALPGSRTHVEAGELRDRVATYTMRLSDDLKSVFDLSAGYDLFLLPQMVLVFYFYVSEKLTDESRRQMFNHFVLDALDSHARWDPRAMQTMIHGPARLLKERGQAA
jgi:hypothetical protein